jgi:hypothetical protein
LPLKIFIEYQAYLQYEKDCEEDSNILANDDFDNINDETSKTSSIASSEKSSDTITPNSQIPPNQNTISLK